MMKILSFLFSILLLLNTSCGQQTKQEGHRSQALLDEATLYIEMRQFDHAEEKIAEALKKIEGVLESEPDNIDVQLLKARAYFTQFTVRNLVILEQAQARPRSLIQLPEMYEYRDYEKTIVPAKATLEKVINQQTLTPEQRGFAHASLAAIFRLNIETAPKADEHYALAIAAYEKWIQQMKSPKTKLESKEINIHHIRGELLQLRMAQVEANLLAEQWVEALVLLERAMGAQDLKYFPVQFELLEEEIATITNKCLEEKTKFDQTRGGKLAKRVEKSRRSRLSYQDQLTCSSPYQFELRQRKRDLNIVQNNLMYRMICYHQLNQTGNFERASHILRTYYPELDQQLESMLK